MTCLSVKRTKGTCNVSVHNYINSPFSFFRYVKNLHFQLYVYSLLIMGNFEHILPVLKYRDRQFLLLSCWSHNKKNLSDKFCLENSWKYFKNNFISINDWIFFLNKIFFIILFWFTSELVSPSYNTQINSQSEFQLFRYTFHTCLHEVYVKSRIIWI